MTSKIIVLFLTLFIFQSCGKDDPQDPNPTSQNFNPDNTEVLVKNSDLGLSSNCTITETSNCESNQSTINICFDCELCQTNPEFADIGFVEILLENKDDRTLTSYGIYELETNYELSASICVEKRLDQTSHIIAFNLIVSDAAPTFQNVAFNNIDLTTGETSNIKKTITTDQFENNSCDSELEVVFSSDPNATENSSKNYSSCIIGSLGDCWEHGNTENVDNWEDTIESIRELHKDFHADYVNSTPCSGIYIQFHD